MGPWNLVDNSTSTVLSGDGAVPTAHTRDRNGQVRELLIMLGWLHHDRGFADQIAGRTSQRPGYADLP